jgi:acyl dehydratase
MTIQPEALLSYDFGQIEHHYVERDAIIYALGLGLGQDPCDTEDLPFMAETGLSVLPTFAVTLSSPGMWIRKPKFGVDFNKLVHSRQMAWFPQMLPSSANVIGEAELVSLTDRGEGKGAELVLERNIRDAENGDHYCRLHQTLLLRGDGGFGGPAAQKTPSMIPDRTDYISAEIVTSQRAALIYRLSGDWNPLHLDPEVAKAAGFEKPILHGLASYGTAGVIVSRALNQTPVNISQLGCSFSGIVSPGDTLEFHIWRMADDKAVFQAFVGDRKVIDQGVVIWKKFG